jgi:hypothetical protein
MPPLRTLKSRLSRAQRRLDDYVNGEKVLPMPHGTWHLAILLDPAMMRCLPQPPSPHLQTEAVEATT